MTGMHKQPHSQAAPNFLFQSDGGGKGRGGGREEEIDCGEKGGREREKRGGE